MKDKFELNIDLALPDLGRAKRAVKRAVKSVKYDVAAFRDRDPAACPLRSGSATVVNCSQMPPSTVSPA